MAPINNKAKPVHRKRPARQEPVRQPSFEDDDSEDDVDHGEEEQQFAIEASNQTHLLDLQDMATRVGEEVDRFAETLDKFNDQLRGANSYKAAHDLCIAYRDHGKDIVNRLKKQHQMQRLQDMKNSFAQRAKTSIFSKSAAAEVDTIADAEGLRSLTKWQAETNTWELFRIMLELRYNPNRGDVEAERHEKLDQLGPHHRYSKAGDVYERFILENDSAKEKHMIVKWLEEAADGAESDVGAMAQELEKKSGRGGGLWMNGWMETREKVKGAKRMRLDDGSALNVRGDKNDALISELDPDAPARQNKALEKGDNYSEQSLWMTCWEMLRRGKSWAEVCDWCLERNQSWRAVSMGLATDKQLERGSAGPAAGALWRKMCFIAAKSSAASDYEAAVYGLLSGNLEAVQKVCKSWDDVLFANYNCALVAEYDAFILRHYSVGFSAELSRKHGLSKAFGQPSAISSIYDVHKLIKSLTDTSATAAESRTPIKLIQASLLANNFADLCQKVGTAISDAVSTASTTAIVKPTRKGVPPGESQQLVEAAIRDDYDALRIVTHMLIMLRGFHAPLSQPADSDAVDNVIAAYVQLLRANEKRDMTPIYASKMRSDRGVTSLAQVVSDIADPQESMDFIKLMEVYGIDAVAVLNGQYSYLLDQVLADQSDAETPLEILEPTDDELYPGHRVRLDFFDPATTNEEEALVSSLAIFFLIEGHWSVTFQALSYTCRKLLTNHRFAAACRLVESLDFVQLSTSKSGTVIGKAIDVMDVDQANLLVARSATDKARQLQVLQRESQAYYDFSILVHAIKALNDWRTVEHEFASKKDRPKTVPPRIKKAFEATKDAIEHVLQGVLMEAADEAEESDFQQIRNTFLPDIILAYNSILCTAGHMISRDELLTAMELSTVIANDASGLAKTFVETKRMKELVRSFAETSKIMLKLNELGRARKEKKKGMGRSIAMWEISG